MAINKDLELLCFVYIVLIIYIRTEEVFILHSSCVCQFNANIEQSVIGNSFILCQNKVISTRISLTSSFLLSYTGRGRSVEPKELMQVNTDAEYLVSHCSGSNYFKEGQDIKLGPDEDYPDWLWDLHIGPPLKLEEMSQDSPQYWRKLREMHMKRNNRLAKVKKF